MEPWINLKFSFKSDNIFSITGTARDQLNENNALLFTFEISRCNLVEANENLNTVLMMFPPR